MKFGQFSELDAERRWIGVLTSDSTVINVPDAGAAAGIELPERTTDLLSVWEWEKKVELTIEHAKETNTGLYDRDEVEQHAPITDPQKIVCVGLNYTDHAKEGGNPIPEEPVLFAKFPTAITAPGSPIRWDPEFAHDVDYEAELVIVVGKEARNVSREDATDYIAGYTVGNDVSARDIQHGDGQWVRGKNLDTFAPIGPYLVTTDDVTDPHDLGIWTEVNGERLQDSTTANFIFGVDEIVSICSQAFTLTPGDLIFTGTPPGVGIYQEPKALLEEGDTVTVGVDGIGTLTNDCEYIRN